MNSKIHNFSLYYEKENDTFLFVATDADYLSDKEEIVSIGPNLQIFLREDGEITKIELRSLKELLGKPNGERIRSPSLSLEEEIIRKIFSTLEMAIRNDDSEVAINLLGIIKYFFEKEFGFSLNSVSLKKTENEIGEKDAGEISNFPGYERNP